MAGSGHFKEYRCRSYHHFKALRLFLRGGKAVETTGAHLNSAPSDSQTRGTSSLPKRKVMSDGCQEDWRKDSSDKGTVSVKPEVGGARQPQSPDLLRANCHWCRWPLPITWRGLHVPAGGLLHLNPILALQNLCGEEFVGSFTPFPDDTEAQRGEAIYSMPYVVSE